MTFLSNGRFIFFILLLGTLTTITSQAQKLKARKYISVKPVDETKSIPDLSLFIRQLIKASARKDTAFVLNVVDDSVAVSYGGGLYGKKEFLQEFIKNANGFEKLKQVLTLGGTVEKAEEGEVIYLFPYVQSHRYYKDQLENIEIDPYLTAFGLDSALVLYTNPKADATKKAILAYPMLQLDPNQADMSSNWVKVSTFENKIKGYVKANKLYYSADISLNIQKKGNLYKITSVAPYD